jgi:hypothetical protein
MCKKMSVKRQAFSGFINSSITPMTWRHVNAMLIKQLSAGVTAHIAE